MNTWPFDAIRLAGFSTGIVDSIIQSDEKMGFPDARTTVSDPVGNVKGHLIFDIEDVALMVTFYETTLVNGSNRFYMIDPIDELRWEWRFLTPFTVSALCGSKMMIGLNFERIPSTGATPPEIAVQFLAASYESA